MNINKTFIIALALLLLSTGLLTTAKAMASSDAPANETPVTAMKSGELYLPSDNPMTDLAVKMEAARDSGKLLLVVLGGNWCHDSRALASRLYEEPLSTTIEAHYEVLFVDVGYLQKGKELITSLGIPVYYATPTVLIVDPLSGHVINAQNRHQWGDAASISMEASLEYFQHFAEPDQSAQMIDENVDPQLHELLVEIAAFEQQMADRIYQAYAVLGPMLKAYKEGAKDGFSEEAWNEVRDFRYKIPVDVDRLRTEARQRVAAGENGIKLSYPVYPAFSWDPK